MTRRKRRKIRGTMKICLLLVLPLAVGAVISAVPSLYQTSRLSRGKTNAARMADEEKETRIYSIPERADDILSGSLILSEGYGAIAETASAGVVKLKSPLEMFSDDPGEKPYPTEWGEGGDIIRNTYPHYTGTTFIDLPGGGQVNNKTSVPNEELLKESVIFPDFSIEDTSEPQVLIYHTHTCESFEPYVRDKFDPSFNYRTTDETKNVVMVGDAIQAELEAKGIGVIHVRTIHDHPSYNGAYDRSRASIVPILEQYPSIKVVLDIHRDAIGNESTANQPYVDIGGREAAQIMIISGCDDGTMGMPDHMKNFHFACSLQEKLESDHKGLTRPVLFDYRCYNQDLTTGSLLIEVGSHGNTLEQVQYSGQLIGSSLGELLCSMKEKK
ncbi:MAG: stage II sporulation protein P [Ruminococcus sp.]|nr:stage II sporulation protein P [Ruminococcus sp.]